MLSKFDHIYKHGMLETAREINPMNFPVGFHGNRMIPVEYYYGHRFYRFEPQTDPAYVPCKCMKPGGCTSWFYDDRLVYPRAAVCRLPLQYDLLSFISGLPPCRRSHLDPRACHVN